jgi:transcriptional regulator GlxA family with amidase domain
MKKKVASRMKRPVQKHRLIDVTVIFLDDGYASTAIAPVEIFHSAGTLWGYLRGEEQRQLFKVRTASIKGKAVKAVGAYGLVPQHALSDIKKTDIVILSATTWALEPNTVKHPALLPWLRKMRANGAYIAGICSGVGYLAEAGLLDGREATTHWGVANMLRARYPDVKWRVDQFVTEDAGMLCSGGVYAAVDLSLYLVEKFCGHEVAVRTAKSLLLSMPRSRQTGYGVVPLSAPHSDEKIKVAEEYLRAHFDRDVSINKLARTTAMSPRNFIRRFRNATGRLPGAYIQLLRVSAARDLLERGFTSVQDVCSKVGYEDVAFFRDLFKRHTGMTPAEYRDTFVGLSFERGDLAPGRTN